MAQGLLLMGGCLYAGAASAQNDNLVLHYNRPAEYFEEALVIGNGTMGPSSMAAHNATCSR